MMARAMWLVLGIAACGDGSVQMAGGGQLGAMEGEAPAAEPDLDVNETPSVSSTGTAPSNEAASPAEVADPRLECLRATGGMASQGAVRGPEPVCGNLHAEAQCRADRAVEMADRTCRHHSDCMSVFTGPSCIDSCLRNTASNAAGAATIAAALDAIDGTLCADFDAEDCHYFASGCPPPPPRVPACREGQCALVDACQFQADEDAGMVVDPAYCPPSTR